LAQNVAAFNLTLKNFKNIQHVVDKYIGDLQDMRPLWNMLEKYVMPANAMKIFVEGQQIWENYKNPTYRSWKYKHGFYLTKLRKTGEMYKAFAVPNSPGNLSVKDKVKWIYGINLRYSHFANKEGYPALHNIGGGKLPQRQWALISVWMQKRMHVMLVHWVQAIMRGEKYQ